MRPAIAAAVTGGRGPGRQAIGGVTLTIGKDLVGGPAAGGPAPGLPGRSSRQASKPNRFARTAAGS